MILNNKAGFTDKSIIKDGNNVFEAVLKGKKGGPLGIMINALDSAGQAAGSLTSNPLPTPLQEVDMNAQNSKSPSFRGR
jgi:hypothetical protein